MTIIDILNCSHQRSLNLGFSQSHTGHFVSVLGRPLFFLSPKTGCLYTNDGELGWGWGGFIPFQLVCQARPPDIAATTLELEARQKTGTNVAGYASSRVRPLAMSALFPLESPRPS